MELYGSKNFKSDLSQTLYNVGSQKEYKVINVLVFCPPQKKKKKIFAFLWNFEFLLTHEYVGVEMSKCYCSYSFHLISSHPNIMRT